MLTVQQSKLLKFIEECLQERGVSPSFEEMRTHLGLGSKSGVHRLLEGLSERGFVKRLRNRARALRVVKGVDEARGFKDHSNNYSDDPAANSESTLVPFLGRVAAGLPIESLGFVDEQQECPSELLGRASSEQHSGAGNTNAKIAQHYALQVEGDSMVEIGILDGDTIIVEASEVARDGELVIALVDGGEATLKILRREGNEVLLEAANEAYETQRFAAGRVRVQGRVTGLLRSYQRGSTKSA